MLSNRTGRFSEDLSPPESGGHWNRVLEGDDIIVMQEIRTSGEQYLERPLRIVARVGHRILAQRTYRGILTTDEGRAFQHLVIPGSHLRGRHSGHRHLRHANPHRDPADALRRMTLASTRLFLFALALSLTTPACAQQQAPAAPADDSARAAAPAAVNYGYRVVATYPHDPRAFTQGLFYLNGHLYESTGQVGQSTIRKVHFEDGRVLQSVPIPPGLFGEGIVNFGNEIVSITWQGGRGFRWDLATLRQTGEWRYEGEGWGLTQNGTDIIMSDGSSALRFLDPVTLAERRRITVTRGGIEQTQLNELEWVNGEIFANVWQTPLIVRIDPASGRVTGVIDLTALAAENGDASDRVLNGIAYDRQRDRLFVTGKYWPRLYEIDLVRAKPSGRPRPCRRGNWRVRPPEIWYSPRAASRPHRRRETAGRRSAAPSSPASPGAAASRRRRSPRRSARDRCAAHIPGTSGRRLHTPPR